MGQELKFEKSRLSEPAWLKSAKIPFQIHDKSGEGILKLTRTFGNEKITVKVHVEEINYATDEAYDDDEEEAVELEDEEGQKKSPSSRNGGEQDMLDNVGDDDDNKGFSFPLNFEVVIEKDGKGALEFSLISQDGEIGFNSIMYYPVARLANKETVEANFESQVIYGGPTFGDLDEDLQMHFQRYLDERGIDSSLAEFLPNYIEYKEEREYANWLDKIRKFVEA